MITFRIADSTRCKSKYSVYVSFPFNMEIVDRLRSYPTRYWNPDTKEWEVPFIDMNYLQSDFKDYKTQTIDERGIIDIAPKKEVKQINYQYKTKPFEHQELGVKYGLEHDKWLLGDEQGLGKSKQAIDIACAKKQQLGYKHCLIICGVNGLKWNWANEVKTHSNETAHILGQRTNKNGLVTIKGNNEKIEDLRNIVSIKDYFIITNVESLRNNAITDILIKLCKSKVVNMIVADEVHKMKNPQSQQGKAFLKLNSEYKLAMTGTPMMNTPLDLYIILKWLEYEQHAYYAFKNHYCMMGGFGGYEVVGYKNLSEITDMLDKIMLRRLKDDVLDLPDKTYVNEFVDMSPKQEVIYKEIKNNLIANIDKVANEGVSPLANLIRLRQATGYTGILSTTIQESAKLDRAEELVEDAIANGKKVVLFSNWTSITDEMFTRLKKKYNGVLITGETEDSRRQQLVDEFQTNNKCKFLLGTTGAIGTGLTLTAGSVEIFLDEPWNAALKEQAEDRCHRIGQKNNITIYTLMCKNTIDEWVHNLVVMKGDMSKLIIDGKPITNNIELVKYLLQ